MNKEERQQRLALAHFWLELPIEQLESAYGGEIGKQHKELLNSTLREQLLTQVEISFVNKLLEQTQTGLFGPRKISLLLASMLFLPPYFLPEGWFEQMAVPLWLIDEYFPYLFFQPELFTQVGEAEACYTYFKRLLNRVHLEIIQHPKESLWLEVMNLVLFKTPFFKIFYFSSTALNIKTQYRQRADIFELWLQQQSYLLDHSFPPRPANRTKIRLGVFHLNFFRAQTEVFSSLPDFEHLDRDYFEIILYTCHSKLTPLEVYCRSKSDKFVVLPKELSQQVDEIRSDNLDMLLIGGNITAVFSDTLALAAHRLARVQFTNFSSPVTTGLHNIDYYVSGTLTHDFPEPQQQYTETLTLVEGVGYCFNYQPAVLPLIKHAFQPSELGITETDVILISGSVFHKILPELQHTWAKILATSPNTKLVLYPFASSWGSNYQNCFAQVFRTILYNYGVSPSRLILLSPLAHREVVKACLREADIYLDSFPYSGANSIVDSLEEGLPTVVMRGNTMRFNQAAALLRTLELPELIAQDEADYIRIVLQLIQNPAQRQQLSCYIHTKMRAVPEFLDSIAHGQRLTELYMKMFERWQTP